MSAFIYEHALRECTKSFQHCEHALSLRECIKRERRTGAVLLHNLAIDLLSLARSLALLGTSGREGHRAPARTGDPALPSACACTMIYVNETHNTKTEVCVNIFLIILKDKTWFLSGMFLNSFVSIFCTRCRFSGVRSHSFIFQFLYVNLLYRCIYYLHHVLEQRQRFTQ